MVWPPLRRSQIAASKLIRTPRLHDPHMRRCGGEVRGKAWRHRRRRRGRGRARRRGGGGCRNRRLASRRRRQAEAAGTPVRRRRHAAAEAAGDSGGGGRCGGGDTGAEARHVAVAVLGGGAGGDIGGGGGGGGDTGSDGESLPQSRGLRRSLERRWSAGSASSPCPPYFGPPAAWAASDDLRTTAQKRTERLTMDIPSGKFVTCDYSRPKGRAIGAGYAQVAVARCHSRLRLSHHA